MEHQELESIQHCVVPVQNQVLLLYLLAPLHHQLQHIFEVGLAQRHLIGIDIILLKCSEKEFRWSKIITVWP